MSLSPCCQLAVGTGQPLIGRAILMFSPALTVMSLILLKSILGFSTDERKELSQFNRLSNHLAVLRPAQRQCQHYSREALSRLHVTAPIAQPYGRFWTDVYRDTKFPIRGATEIAGVDSVARRSKGGQRGSERSIAIVRPTDRHIDRRPIVINFICY